MKTYRAKASGFTLVEILIVVIILGILAAIVIPQFTSASQDARKNSLVSQLQTIKAQLELARLQHLDKDDAAFVAGGAATVTAPGPWAKLVIKTNAFSDAAGNYDTTPVAPATQCPFGPYLQAPPANTLNGFMGVSITAVDVVPGAAYSGTGMGWVYNPNDGKCWATSSKQGFIYNDGNPGDPNNDQ